MDAVTVAVMSAIEMESDINVGTPAKVWGGGRETNFDLSRRKYNPSIIFRNFEPLDMVNRLPS